MEASGAPTEVLLQRPWLPVSISGCRLHAKSWFGETTYHVLLTDMHCVWEERMDSAAIQQRSQELNRRLRAPVKAFFSHLCEVVQPCLSGSDGRPDDEAQISLTRQEDGDISMKLKSELAGLPFYWEFHCTPAPVTVVCAQLVCPLLAMSHLLQLQVEQLGGLLARKDAEIQDYRENGATLSRERLQTDVFEEQTYRQDFMAKLITVTTAVCSRSHPSRSCPNLVSSHIPPFVQFNPPVFFRGRDLESSGFKRKASLSDEGREAEVTPRENEVARNEGE